MNYDVTEIRDIVDELIRLGLVKEIWPSGSNEPRYVTTEYKGVD